MSGRKRDEEDGVFDDDDDDNEDDDDDDDGEVKQQQSRPAKKRKKGGGGSGGMFDDAAEESGDEDDEEDEEEEDDNNEYVKDGFVVDEDEDEDEYYRRRKKKKKRSGDLEDSDDDDDGDDDDSDDDGGGPRSSSSKLHKKKRRLKKGGMRLDEDDLALIQEAGGGSSRLRREYERELEEESIAAPSVKHERVVAKSAEELRKGLFYDSGGEDGGGAGADGGQHRQQQSSSRSAGGPASSKLKQRKQQQRMADRFDEDGMDDFIEDDIGDQEGIMAGGGGGYGDDDDRGGVSELQLQQASEIFGTDYLQFMGDDGAGGGESDGGDDIMGQRSKFHERGVGVDLGVDSDDELLSDDDDDDMFDDDDGDDAVSAEARKLKREKRRLAKQERRREQQQRKAAKRKAAMRRAFEPVQLVENFCTDRDDDIRQLDAPERFYDWIKSSSSSARDGGDDGDSTRRAVWIATHIPAVAAEYGDADTIDARRTPQQRAILDSVQNALKFMRKDKLEPAFVKRYRKDDVPVASVRDDLYSVLDQDSEWRRLQQAKEKVQDLLREISADAAKDRSSTASKEAADRLREELDAAQEKLDETAKQESAIKKDLQAVTGGGKDDEDDELFGDGDNNDEDDEEKAKEKERLKQHLSTVQSLLEARAEKVSQLQARAAKAQADGGDAAADASAAERVAKKTLRGKLWNAADYRRHLRELRDSREVLDLNGYLNLLKEGNDAIRQKETPNAAAAAAGKDTAKDGVSGGGRSRKRSRRFDRDFYRTCVSEGLRAVAYRFLLSPHRVGIKLQDNNNAGANGGFDFSKTLPREEDDDEENDDGGDGGGEGAAGDPLQWVPPVIPSMTPMDFASQLIGSGELVLLSSGGGDTDDAEARDPLRGCRYTAAQELAQEPRVRAACRTLYRRQALLSTRPSKRGLDEIDAFHEYYGLHLIRNKPAKEHWDVDPVEAAARKAHLGAAECHELDREMKKRQTDSCLQYLNVVKAEQAGYVTVHVHLPLQEVQDSDWHKRPSTEVFARANQDASAIMSELEKAYLPPDGDSEEWNEERRKVLQQALQSFLLPVLELEVRRDLREAAIKVGVKAAAESLHGLAMEGPYRPAALVHSENRFLYPTPDLTLLGVCVAPDSGGRDATYLAAVVEHGEVGDHFAVPAGTQINQGKMREKVINFLMQQRPAAVVVGTSGGFAARMMARKLADLVQVATDRWSRRYIQGDDEDDEAFEQRRNRFQNLQRNPTAVRPYGDYDRDDDDDDVWKCNVELVDDSIAQLFGRSVRGKKEFPEHDVNLKCAIATARHAKDPAAELTYAWSVASDAGVFGTEMLFLNVHPLQKLLPQHQLLQQYERTLCEVVADVGVDVNACTAHDNLRGYLMFVPGLGPRKASNLKQTVVAGGGSISKRRHLLEKRYLGPVVYNNAVAFLRIRLADNLEDQILHPLDDTRLHPDVYQRNKWAIKIAFDALEREEGRSGDSAVIKAVRDVMDNSASEVERLYTATKQEWEQHYGPTFNSKDWDPRINVPADMWRDKVEELDLDAFANMIEENGQGKWHSHLEMIKWEYRLPFADPRLPMEPLSGDKLFRLITGESDVSLRPGKEVTGKIVKITEYGCRVKLEGDVPAFIPTRCLSDDHFETPEDVVNTGQVVTAIILDVKKDHMSVDMSLKMNDFRKSPAAWPRPESLPAIDDYFDMSASNRLGEEHAKQREAHITAVLANIGGNSRHLDGDAAGGKPKVGRVMRRACTHPAFRNAKNVDVMAELKDGGAAMVGEALIRPSSKSSDSLAVHWVVKEGSIKVVEVLEEDKETEASIGNVLKIKNETYGSIDELLGRFVAPMNDYVEELVSHRKFMDLPEDDVDDRLKAMKKATPSSIPYAVCWMEMHPGYASLRFVSSSTPRNHPIGISPDGFNWGSTTYATLDELINAFKKNPRGTSSRPRQSGGGGGSSSTGQTPSRPALPVPPANKPPPPPKAAGGRWGPAAAAPAPGAGWNGGARPAPPPRPPPPVPPAAAATTPAAPPAWSAQQQQSSWNSAAPARPAPPPPRPPPPRRPPPPPVAAAGANTTNAHLPPPPTYSPPPPPSRPPPPGMPQQRLPPSVPPPQGLAPPTGVPPTAGFGGGVPGQGRGRGRGMTLPAWMNKS